MYAEKLIFEIQNLNSIIRCIKHVAIVETILFECLNGFKSFLFVLSIKVEREKKLNFGFLSKLLFEKLKETTK